MRKILAYFFPMLEAHYAVLFTIVGKDFYVGKGLTFEQAVDLANEWQKKNMLNMIIEDTRK